MGADVPMTMLHSGVPTFLKLPHLPLDTDAIAAHGATAAFLGAPLEMASVYRPGASFGPQSLRLASEQYDTYHFEWDVDLVERYRMVDAGDAPVYPALLARSHQAIEEACDALLAAGCMPVLVGGDHSVTIPGVRACARHQPGRLGVLVLDTHMDSAASVNGEPCTHCSPVARAAETPGVSPANIAVVGLHGAMNPRKEKEFLQEHGIVAYTMTAIWERGLESVMEEALARVRDGVDGLYVSLDIDVVDAAFAPGTSGPEPGGMTTRELLTACRLIARGGFAMLDVTEVCPQLDPSGITARLACAAIIEMLALKR